jgi:hypothetical protein
MMGDTLNLEPKRQHVGKKLRLDDRIGIGLSLFEMRKPLVEKAGNCT